MPNTKKLDYLSKYRDDAKKKKSKKRKKKKGESSRTTTDIKDEDAVPDVLQQLPEDDDEDDESDAPVVVMNGEYTAVSQQGVTKGKWETEGTVPPKRRRHDSSSDDDEECVGKKEAPRRRRHDSDASEEEISTRQQEQRQRKRHDSDDDSSEQENVRRKRHDSDSISKPEARKRRYDSSSSDEEDVSPRRKQRNDSFSDRSSSSDGKERMSSGHIAGLQKSGHFSKQEARIQQKRKKAAQEMVDKYGMGETVYRDSSSTGRHTIGDKQKGEPKKLSEEEQRLLNTGRAQLELEQQQKRDFEALQSSAFARRDDDAGLEDWRKNAIREGDPMAAAAAAATKQKHGDGGRPVYKGPPPKPNRFGIPPGHRWDAKDRGNGFEDKLLAKRFSSQHDKERDYRYSAADM